MITQQHFDFGGMTRSFEHASRADAAWPIAAYNFLRKYAESNEHFEAWEVTNAADAVGLAPITGGQAWGHLYSRALRELWLHKVDKPGRSPNRHGSVCNRYLSRVFVGGSHGR